MKFSTLAAIIGALIIISAAIVAHAGGDCSETVNAPIDGNPTSTMTWCPGSDNPVFQPKL